MRKSKDVYQSGSFDADKDPEEKSLTQYNSALRSEWTGDGFQQTHIDMN